MSENHLKNKIRRLEQIRNILETRNDRFVEFLLYAPIEKILEARNKLEVKND